MGDDLQGCDDKVKELNEENPPDLVDHLIRAEFAEVARTHLLGRRDRSQDSGDGGSGTEDHDKPGSDGA